MGRFMSPDWAAKPVTIPYAEFGDPQSLNLYSYVRNSPIIRIDVDGHFDDPFGLFGMGSTSLSNIKTPGHRKGDEPRAGVAGAAAGALAGVAEGALTPTTNNSSALGGIGLNRGGLIVSPPVEFQEDTLSMIKRVLYEFLGSKMLIYRQIQVHKTA
jgi:hypothetical protein